MLKIHSPGERITACCTLLTVLWSLSGSVIAESPESIEGATSVNAEQIMELVASTPGLTVIDSRLAGDRNRGYIEGSISLPNIETNCDSLADAMPARDAPALFYCNGVKCGRSAKAVRIALDCGYSELYWFRGGFEEWLAKGYPVLRD